MEETETTRETPDAGTDVQTRADDARDRADDDTQTRVDDAKIRVDVETSFVPGESDPAKTRYVFAYTITIRNEGAKPARLLTRHWIITDANGQVQEVRGDGVVGEQPYLKPGQRFRYTSGAVIETPVGVMQGSYQMISDDGHKFDASIAPFRLAMPGILH